MSKESIIASINTYIKENGNLAITGQILNSVMNEMVEGLASEEELATKQDTTSLVTDLAAKVNALSSSDKAAFLGQISAMPATPSGDPMHYAYEAAGAEWNGTGADIVKTAPWADMVDDDADKVVTHKAGYWYVNGLGDITNEQMRIILLETNNFLGNIQSSGEGFYVMTHFRTNLPMPTYRIALYRLQATYIDCFRGASNLEAIVFVEYANGTLPKYSLHPKSMNAMFNNDNKLRHISGLINLDMCVQANDAFFKCYELRSIKLYSLKFSMDFKYSSFLNSKSILYMIQNEAATSAITITLHANAYARAMANADIVAALQAHPNVSLASA